jgi:hypothetical protein
MYPSLITIYLFSHDEGGGSKTDKSNLVIFGIQILKLWINFYFVYKGESSDKSNL